MSREFKFRLWDENAKLWLSRGESVELAFSQKFPESISAKVGFYLEQYTGFKDKNGKEIYEGDIVKAKGEAVIDQCIFLDAIAEVVWAPSAAGFGEKFVGKDKPMVPFGNFEYEVIGNIHENPELLEERER